MYVNIESDTEFIESDDYDDGVVRSAVLHVVGQEPRRVEVTILRRRRELRVETRRLELIPA